MGRLGSGESRRFRLAPRGAAAASDEEDATLSVEGNRVTGDKTGAVVDECCWLGVGSTEWMEETSGMQCYKRDHEL